MSITLELPTELERVLQAKAQGQGLSVPDLLLRLARTEAESGLYTSDEVQGYMEADVLPAELSSKVQQMLRT